MTEQQQAKFDGWAIVDVLGHQRYVGYVTTEAFGAAVLFRVDVPALEARERVTKRPGYLDGHGFVPADTKVTEGAVAGYTKLIGSGSIYTITPCTKEAALEAVEHAQHRPLMNVTLPPGRAIGEGPRPGEFDDDNVVDDFEDEPEGGEDMEGEGHEGAVEQEQPAAGEQVSDQADGATSEPKADEDDGA